MSALAKIFRRLRFKNKKTATATNLIRLRNVTKQYSDSIVALRGVNLTIHEGEFVFIVGDSGSGKSTLLKLLMKEEEPTAGKIDVFGYDLLSMKRRDIPYYRRTMGIVFQDFRIIENMTVFQNVAFAMRIAGAPLRKIKKRVSYVLSLFSIEDKANRFPRELSGGEKQRVGLARALANNPSLIVADEPTGNIDPSMSFDIINLLSQVNKKGTTVIVVTHDISVVEQFKFRTIEIINGKITKDIPKAEEKVED